MLKHLTQRPNKTRQKGHSGSFLATIDNKIRRNYSGVTLSVRGREIVPHTTTVFPFPLRKHGNEVSNPAVYIANVILRTLTDMTGRQVNGRNAPPRRGGDGMWHSTVSSFGCVTDFISNLNELAWRVPKHHFALCQMFGWFVPKCHVCSWLPCMLQTFTSGNCFRASDWCCRSCIIMICA